MFPQRPNYIGKDLTGFPPAWPKTLIRMRYSYNHPEVDLQAPLWLYEESRPQEENRVGYRITVPDEFINTTFVIPSGHPIKDGELCIANDISESTGLLLDDVRLITNEYQSGSKADIAVLEIGHCTIDTNQLPTNDYLGNIIDFDLWSARLVGLGFKIFDGKIYYQSGPPIVFYQYP